MFDEKKYFRKIIIIILIILLLSLFKNFLINHLEVTLAEYWTVRIFLIIIFVHIILKNKCNVIINSQKINSYSKSSYIGLLNVRALAIICVLLGHWFAVTFPPFDLVSKVNSGGLVWVLTGAANAGVWIFFSLSGYLMGKGFFTNRYGYDGRGVFHYFVGRFFKIYPIYIISVTIVGILNNPEIFNFKNLQYLDNFFSIIFFDMPRLGPIGALWSITTEVQFYCLVPPLCFYAARFLSTSKRCYIFIGLVFITFPLIKFFLLKKYGMSIWIDYIYFPVLANLDCFLIGTVSSLLINKYKNFLYVIKNTKSNNLGFILIALCYLFMAYLTAKILINNTADFNRPFILRGILFFSIMPVITSLITWALIQYYEQANLLADKLNIIGFSMKKLGILAYVIYVWHSPIYLSLRKIAPENITLSESFWHMFFMLPILFFIAYTLYRSIELPLNKLGHKYIKD